MKNSLTILLLSFILMSQSFSSRIEEKDYTGWYHYGWFSPKDLIFTEDGIYLDTAKGPVQANVEDYDIKNDRYLIKGIIDFNGFVVFEDY